MSKVAISGDSSGTGTFTIKSPNSNTDRTLNLPDNSGTVLTTATPGVPVNGPAFSAYMGSSQTVTQSVRTKLRIDTEEFDTNSCYDTSLYRFTPNVAGYYQVSANGYLTNGGQIYNQISVYKNGSIYKAGSIDQASGAYMMNMGCLVYLNGTTDYIELYGETSGGTPSFAAGAAFMYFQAAMVRAA